MFTAVAGAFAAELSDSGVDRLFGFPGGGGWLQLDEAFRQRNIELVPCRYEAYLGHTPLTGVQESVRWHGEKTPP